MRLADISRHSNPKPFNYFPLFGCLVALGIFVGFCDCAVIQSHNLNDSTFREEPSFDSRRWKFLIFNNSQCQFDGKQWNCSDLEGEIVPLNLTKDGYLKILDDEGNIIYFPPEQFCISKRGNYAKLCTSHLSPKPWRKCCPAQELINPDSKFPATCMHSSSQFRPKINDVLESFFVVSNTKFTCPDGFHLKKFSQSKCAEKSMTRFRLSRNGTISYEVATGVFLRKSEWMDVKPSLDLYCLDGVINPVSSCLQSSSFRSISIIRSHSFSQTNNKNAPKVNEACDNEPTPVLYICQKITESHDIDEDNIPAKTTFLAVIWAITCPLLFGASLGNSFVIQQNIHGKILTCYLLSMVILNILSVIVILKVGRESKVPQATTPPPDDYDSNEEKFAIACTPLEFAIKFMYMSTLCWMTSINFGLWKTFSFTLPQPAGLRRFIASSMFSLGFPAISIILCYYVPYWDTDLNCKREFCLLYSYDTVFFYTIPMSLMVLGNFTIFLRTSYKITLLRKEAEDVLKRQAQDHLESFTLFAKLFLLTGSIWLLKLVLLVLQIQGKYFTWYGMALEMLFSTPEVIFPMIVFHHPEFIKWTWANLPNVSHFVAKFDPFFNIPPEIKK